MNACGTCLGRARSRALGRLEPDDGKLSRPVLRGGRGGNTAPLLDRLTTQVDSNSGGTALVTFVDGYDAVGNRVSRVKDGVATTWVYDAVYRLTNQQKSGQAASFVYDNAGVRHEVA